MLGAPHAKRSGKPSGRERIEFVQDGATRRLDWVY